VNVLAQSTIFENLLESNYTILPKQKLFLMACSISVKIYKKNGAMEVLALRVQTGLSNSVPDFEIF
jgi:hypothetical protein